MWGRRSKACRSRAGMTLVEMSIASTLIVVVSAGIVQFSDTSYRAYETLNQSDAINQKGWMGIEKVTRKLRSAGTATNLLSGVWLDEAQFRSCKGFHAGEATMGDLERISFRLDPNEEVDGEDNDGDGLIDEGEVIWEANYAESAGEVIILCRSVLQAPEGEILGNGVDDNRNGLIDEPGFGIREENGRIDLVLTIAQRVPSGQILERTMRRSLALRMEISESSSSESDGQAL